MSRPLSVSHGRPPSALQKSPRRQGSTWGLRRPPGIGTTTGGLCQHRGYGETVHAHLVLGGEGLESLAHRAEVVDATKAFKCAPWQESDAELGTPVQLGPVSEELAKREADVWRSSLPHSGSAVMDNRCATAPFVRTGELRTKSALSRRLSLWFRIAGRTQIVQLPRCPPPARPPDAAGLYLCFVPYLLRLTPEGANRPRPSATGSRPASGVRPQGRSRAGAFVAIGLACAGLAARSRSARRTWSKTAPACWASSAHSVGPGRSLLAWSTRSAIAIWRRARSVCGLHPVQGGMAPSLRSRAASMSRAWWHHTALPQVCPAALRSAGPGGRAGRRRGRRPGRGGCGPGRRRPGRG